jgi:hypothetical protein
MGSRELKESCVCCFITVHQHCLAEQLEYADWSAIKDRSAVELFCCGCIVERFTEVGLLVSLLRETGAEFSIFEPVVDAFMSEKSEGVWKRCARNAVKVWACTLTSAKKPPSPWAKGPKPGSEEPLPEVSLSLVAKKPLELKTALRPSAKVEVVGSTSSGLGSGESESALARRIDELQKQISGMALPLAPELPKLRAGVVRCAGTHEGFGGVRQRFAGRVQAESCGCTQHPEFYTRVDYLGMRTVMVQDKARMQRYIGADRVDLYVRFRDCAEAQGVQQSFIHAERNGGASHQIKEVYAGYGDRPHLLG